MIEKILIKISNYIWLKLRFKIKSYKRKEKRIKEKNKKKELAEPSRPSPTAEPGWPVHSAQGKAVKKKKVASCTKAQAQGRRRDPSLINSFASPSRHDRLRSPVVEGKLARARCWVRVPCAHIFAEYCYKVR